MGYLTLAFYLTPALLPVLLVGGIGMIVLAIARVISSIIHARPLKASSGG
jgi:hypothetical protein